MFSARNTTRRFNFNKTPRGPQDRSLIFVLLGITKHDGITALQLFTMMRLSSSLVSLLLTAYAVMGFAPTSSFTRFSMSAKRTASSPTILKMALSKGDRVLLIGPGFLQLNIAKAAKAAGLKPMIIADKKKLETFESYVNDAELMSDATYGMPEVHEPGFGEIAGVVFCAEEAVLGPNVISAVLDYTDKGESIFAGGSPKRVVACAPVTGVQRKEKSMGWIPLLNNDNNAKQTWQAFIDAYQKHPYAKSSVGSLVRFGSLLGGSVDGIEALAELGLDEKMYKVRKEQGWCFYACSVSNKTDIQ